MPEHDLREVRCEDGRLIVTVDDITSFPVDAIVNAANSGLMGGGGVDGAIHRAGGPQILRECMAVRRSSYPTGLPPGEAVVTTAGHLPARFVIHTVGPVWHGGGHGEDDILANAYRNCLRLAKDRGVQTIAFPAISTGVYHYPKDRAAGVAHAAIVGFLRSNDRPSTVYLVFFSQSDADVFLQSSPCH